RAERAVAHGAIGRAAIAPALVVTIRIREDPGEGAGDRAVHRGRRTLDLEARERGVPGLAGTAQHLVDTDGGVVARLVGPDRRDPHHDVCTGARDLDGSA